MKISIFASIWAQNLWDELILKNEIKILEQKFWASNFFVFSYDYKNPFFEAKNIEYKEYFPIWIKKTKNIFRNIKNFFIFLKTIIISDLIVIWWWWLFFDTEVWNKKNPLWLWLFRMFFFRLFRKKVYFFRVWLSIRKEESFYKIKKIFSYNNAIIELRDNYSFKVLQDLWIENIKREYDPVFFDNSSDIKKILSKKVIIKKVFDKLKLKDLENIDFSWKKVWIAFRRWYFNKNFELEILMIKEIIEYINSKNPQKIILLAHSFSKNDILSNDFKWMELIKKWLNNIEISKSLYETYSFYKERKLDLVLAQRLHSMILSQVYKIPFIWISYSTKTKEFLSS